MNVHLFPELIFWFSFLLLFYTYLGYPVFLWIALKLRKEKKRKELNSVKDWPAVTLIIPAYNEQAVIREKLTNALALDYPSDKLHILVIADGSQDDTVKAVGEFEQVRLLYQSQREGKSAALNRAMSFVHTPYVIFSDANGLLNPQAVKYLLQHFEEPRCGIVSGEKRVLRKRAEAASQAGEGLYWQYESWLKALESEFHLLFGTAGELFAMRSSLFKSIPTYIINEDFYLSMQIARRGYKLLYEARAVSYEAPSEGMADEIRRKVRISAGGLQSVRHFYFMLNPLSYGWLSFEFFSHKFLRWTLAPVAIVLMLFAHSWLAWAETGIYPHLFLFHSLFYAFALAGYLLSHFAVRFKPLFIPFYFLMMHFCVFAGGWNLLRNKYLVLWPKARRSEQSREVSRKH